ncbi:MAG: type II secretion system inner membrane protein GspF [Pseudomonadota bacterium]
MPVYEYSAFDSKGKNKSGIIEADNLVVARQKLRSNGLFPVEVKESQAQQKIASRHKVDFALFFKRAKQGDITVMTRQLAVLLKAGLPLVTAMNAIIQQTAKEGLKKVLISIKDDVNEGQSLAAALSRYPKIFAPFYVNIVRAGEASGTLDMVLNRLAELRERQQAQMAKIKAALTYPILMGIVGVLVLFFMMTVVVPQVTQIFTDMKQTLPAMTLVLIAISGVFKSYWWAMIIMIIAGFIGFSRFTKSGKGLKWRDTVALRFPVAGPLRVKLIVARFTQTLGSLLENGVPLLSALEIVRNVVNNSVVADLVARAKEDVSEGKDLASALGREGMFPPIVLQMISVGEQSGELEQMLFTAARAYENEVESGITGLTSILEPLMILVLAGGVGFVVVAILMPMLEMSSMIK